MKTTVTFIFSSFHISLSQVSMTSFCRYIVINSKEIWNAGRELDHSTGLSVALVMQLAPRVGTVCLW